MSNTLPPQQNYSIDYSEYFANVDPDWPTRYLVSVALNRAHVAFAMQCKHPDSNKYTETCDELARFLDLATPLEQSEQRTLVQILSAACAMQEIAVNSTALSKAQHSAYLYATANLTNVCRKALDNGVLQCASRYEAFKLKYRAEQALARAIDELDRFKYRAPHDLPEDNCSCYGSGNSAGSSTAPSPASPSATPRISSHNITDPHQVFRPTLLEENAMPSANKDCPTQFPPPLGFTYLMPTVSQPTMDTYLTRAGTVNTHYREYGNHASGIHK